MRLLTILSTLVLLWLALFGASALADEPSAEEGKVDSTISPLLQQFTRKRESTSADGGSQPASDTVTRGQSAESGATTKDDPGPDSDTATGGQSTYSGAITKDAPGKDNVPSEPNDSLVRFDSTGNVQVYIHLENTDESTLKRLRDLGANIEVTYSDGNVLQAWVPVSALDQIAALDAVQEITSPDYGVAEAGSVTTEGDAIHRADLVRAFSGLTGKGVKVGVISDGVDARHTARGRGDLPNGIEIDPHRSGNGDEGTALLEIVHDLAHDARLAFSGPDTLLEMVDSILWLANEAFNGEGVGVIVDDLGYFLQPFFEDGLVALAAADAVAGGAVFVSAAGNNANKHYGGEFVYGESGFHDFDPSGATDIALRIEGRQPHWDRFWRQH